MRIQSMWGFLIFLCSIFPLWGYASDFSVDLKGQITNASHGEASTRIDIAVKTIQSDPYPYTTNIVVACYDAKQYAIKQRLVAWKYLQIQWISSTRAAYVSLDIPKTNVVQTILCHIDDTNVVPEINESNQIGWIHIEKWWWTSVPVPVPVPTPTPTPVPPVCKGVPVEVCEESIQKARWDKYMSSLWLTIPAQLQHIKKYRIQRLDGSWSKRYVPWVDDIDWKNNCDYASVWQVWTTCQRRVWSFFDDHTYQISSCKITRKQVCEDPIETPYPQPSPKPPIETPKPSPTPWQTCRHGYCWKPLPPVSKPPIYTPKPPVYTPRPQPRPTPVDPYLWGGLSPCFGSDCGDDNWYYNDGKEEKRRIVDPQSINTSFKWLSWVR
jgi:hypothetical protein